MPRMTERDAIRAIMEADRSWSLYALGDLSPGLFEQCDWFAAARGEPALVLLYRGAGTPVLLAVGVADAVAPLLREIAHEPTLFLHIRPEIISLLRPDYDVRDERPMWRMILDPAQFPPLALGEVTRLGPKDLPAMQALFVEEDRPDFFFPSMVTGGVFYGIREGDGLIAVAGTHLVVPTEGVAAVGNVYTRRDRRGRGLGISVTGAVTRDLLRMGLRTIGLNVSHTNTAAIRVYERLGYVRYCEFREGIAIRAGAAGV